MPFPVNQRDTLVVVGALVAYAIVAGAVGAAQLAKTRRAERVQRWNGVFRGEGDTRARVTNSHSPGLRRAA